MADRRDEDVASITAGRRRLRTALIRIALAGVLVAIASWAIGRALVAWQLGDDAQVLERLERDTRTVFSRDADRLRREAARIAASPAVVDGLAMPRDTPRRIFAALEEAPAWAEGASAVTVFDLSAQAVAWTGRPSEQLRQRVQDGQAIFVAQGALGLRLIAVEPVFARDGPAQRRVGSVAAELLLSTADGTTTVDTFVVRTWLGPVTLRLTFGERAFQAAKSGDPHRFILRAPSGEALLEASVPDGAPELVRSRWRGRANSVALIALALAMLGLATRLFAERGRRPRTIELLPLTLSTLAAIAAARALLWLATPPEAAPDSLRSALVYASHLLPRLNRSPIDLLFTALAAGAIVLALIDPCRAWILGRRGRRQPFPGGTPRTLRALLVHLLAGAVVLALEAGTLAIVGDTARNTSINLLRLTVLPWEAPRLTLLVALVLLQASAIWAGIVTCRVALAQWRVTGLRWLVPAMWVLPAFAAAAAPRSWIDLPGLPLVLAAVLVAVAAWTTRRGVPWYRHGSQAGRLGWRLVVLVVPAWLLYPALVDTVERAKRQLVEETYSRDVRSHPQELQAHLQQALKQIDAFDSLPDLVRALEASPGRPSTEAAFSIWRQTELEEFRLTSAVEVYGANGALVSRFALNFPETEAVPLDYQSGSCRWETFGEAQPFGADERSMLHAERPICEVRDGRNVTVGTIVVHVMLDYSALNFISSQSPYFEFIRAPRAGPRDGTAGSDVELAIFGWGRLLLYSSSSQAWRLPDDVFDRVLQSRQPFWTTLRRGETVDHAFVSNDRNGIYIVGYPVLTLFNHLVHLGELTTIAALTFVVLVLGSSVLWSAAGRGHTYPAQLLVREIRASFYRKLFLAFVAATVVPVLLLALLVRAYFTNQLFNDVEAEAARTALTTKRVIEESLALQRDSTTSSGLSDEVMVWISRVINQDVNIFDGPRLLVTSERDLFESGLLPTRTPDEVYEAVALERLPTYVGQDSIGDFSYLVAAAPVRVANRDAILTVPLASRQREILREIEDLDRGVHLGALLLIVLGSALGYWMAERIGDPVQRLTRATRRIAAGDLSARVIVRTADELQRLVEAFNRMAGELQRQRQQLERTNRLEAWAEMARQVAHDIKNPLTPIQLSAEHLRRVHQDRGEPLSPVLESCVDSILTQVRLLRQISSEFSSFGSSRTPRPAPTSLPDLLLEVVDPYRAGMNGRVQIDLETEPGLPDAMVDRVLVARAVTNIIENALHAMPSGGTLAIEVHRDRDMAVLSLADTGIGMDEEAMARIFEPYFSTKAAGTGLGLSIARRNVELNGGTIEVSSRKGEGTTVTLRLPLAATAGGARVV